MPLLSFYVEMSIDGFDAITGQFSGISKYHGTHHAALASSELPECLAWLWRDYDPKKTEQLYEQSADEKSKPPFRVRVYNR